MSGEEFVPYAPPPVQTASMETTEGEGAAGEGSPKVKRKWLPREEWLAQQGMKEEVSGSSKKSDASSALAKTASATALEQWVGAKPGSGLSVLKKPKKPRPPADARVPPPSPGVGPREPVVLITRILDDGTVMAVHAHDGTREFVLQDPALQEYQSRHLALSQGERDEARDAILSKGLSGRRVLQYDRELVDLCRPKTDIRSVRDLESYMRRTAFQTASNLPDLRRRSAHILKEYHLPVDFGKDAKDAGPVAEYFGVRFRVPFEVRVCVAYGLLLLDKIKPRQKPSWWTDSSRMPILGLSPFHGKRDYALRRIDSSDFTKIMTSYGAWRRRALFEYLSFADRARLPRVCRGFRDLFPRAADLGKALSLPVAEWNFASTRFRDEAYASCRIAALLLGKAVDAYSKDENLVQNGLGHFPEWLAANRQYKLERPDGKLPLFYRIQGKTVDDILGKTKNYAAVAGVALKRLAELKRVLASGLLSIRYATRSLQLESVLRYRALWATVAGCKPSFKAAPVTSKQRSAGQVALEVELRSGHSMLFLEIDTGTFKAQAGIDLSDGIVYAVPSARREGESNKPIALDIDRALFSKRLRSAKRDEDLVHSIQTAFRDAGARRNCRLLC
jgi:hypothetical protein